MTEKDTAAKAAGNGKNEAPAREMTIQKIYLKDASFEAPNSPTIFQGKWRPQVNVDLDSKAERMEDDLYHVVLTVTVTAKQEDKTAFLVELSQAGIFRIKGADKAEMGPVLGSYCPGTLFPFARQAISELVTQGGFPQLLLAPVNFDALYADHVRRQQAAGEGEAPGADKS